MGRKTLRKQSSVSAASFEAKIQNERKKDDDQRKLHRSHTREKWEERVERKMTTDTATKTHKEFFLTQHEIK